VSQPRRANKTLRANLFTFLIAIRCLERYGQNTIGLKRAIREGYAEVKKKQDQKGFKPKLWVRATLTQHPCLRSSILFFLFYSEWQRNSYFHIPSMLRRTDEYQPPLQTAQRLPPCMSHSRNYFLIQTWLCHPLLLDKQRNFAPSPQLEYAIVAVWYTVEKPATENLQSHLDQGPSRCHSWSKLEAGKH